MNATASRTVVAKAAAYLANGRVREVTQSRIFLVEGSAPEPYAVIVSPGNGSSCSCPALGMCAHRCAAEKFIEREAKTA